MGLNPAQGLPAGVVNPNAPPPSSTFTRPGIDFGDFGGDQVLPMTAGRGADAGGAFLANRFSAFAPRAGMAFNGGPNNAGILPGGVNASTNQGGTAIQANGSPGMVPRTDGGTAGPFLENPDAHNFGAGGLGTDTTGTNSFGSLAQGFNQTFQSPDAVTEQNDPGYQFRLQQGQLALQNSAAARGGLLTGGTAKALDDYNQNAASNEYSNVYNRALQNFDTNYNVFKNNQTDEFNRLMALQNGGQVSGQNLSASGITAANNAANIGLTSAGQIGQQLNNAGAATASGYIGGANAITGAINGGANSLSTLALLQMLKQGGG